MLGRPSSWLRWLLFLGALVVGLRVLATLALPLLPDSFAWASSVMLGAAMTFFLLPLPHEATLPADPRPEHPPRPEQPG